ncbi:MAG: FtsH protease activity modulator HflK [Acidobacteria bacterium]|nr:FtsH protease activity modulator HflK [Acidobacteriota bacterium]
MNYEFLKLEEDQAEGALSFHKRKSAIRNPQSAILLLLLLYMLSGVYFVGPEQQAVVTRFDRVVAKGVTPGIHYHLPWPIESIIKLKVLETKRLTIGMEIPDQVLGRTAAEDPVEYLTGDQNIITVQVAVQYQIKDPVNYLYRSQDVARMIARAVESAFAQTIAIESVDSILTTGKVNVQNATQRRAREILDRYESGVYLSSINIENVAPPLEVTGAFREVASARADRDRIINEAHGYANDAIAKAQGEAQKLVIDAESYSQQRINEAQGEAARFEMLRAESSKARDLTERRLYLETMEEVLPKVKKVVIDSSGPRSLMDLGIIRSNVQQ